MYPVDARAASFGIHRSGTAEHQHRHAVDVGVEYRHAGVLQTNHVVADGDHRFVFRFSVTVSDSNGNLFVMAEDHFGLVIATIIYDGIMNAAERCAGIECGVLDIMGFHQIDDDVRAVLRLFLLYSGHLSRPPSKTCWKLNTRNQVLWLGLL